MKKQYLQLATNNLKYRKIRTILTLLGIIIGITTIISLVTVGENFKDSIEEQFETLGITTITLVPPDLTGPPSPGITIPNEISETLRNYPEIEYIDPTILNFETITFGKQTTYTSITSYDTTIGERRFTDTNIELESGRYFKKNEKGSTIIGYNIAKDFFDKEIRARNTLKIGTENYKVIGVLSKTGTQVDDEITISLDDAREQFSRNNDVNFVTIKIKQGLDTELTAEKIEKRLKQKYDEDTFDLLTPTQILQRINEIIGAVQITLGSIAGIAIIVGAVGIINSMYTSVLERTKEIGILKSIGASSKDILYLFLIESAVIGLIGGIIGITLGTILSYLIADLLSINFILQIDVIFYALLFSIIIGIISGLTPAYRASKHKPTEALRNE